MILTKKEFCKYTIDKHLRSLGDDLSAYRPNWLVKIDDEWIRQVTFKSTTIGICLQELGYITEEKHPDLIEYLSNRGGLYATYINRDSLNDPDNNSTEAVKVMTFRELLSLLPD